MVPVTKYVNLLSSVVRVLHNNPTARWLFMKDDKGKFILAFMDSQEINT
jgi:hypothetical protein